MSHRKYVAMLPVAALMLAATPMLSGVAVAATKSAAVSKVEADIDSLHEDKHHAEVRAELKRQAGDEAGVKFWTDRAARAEAEIAAKRAKLSSLD